MLRVKDYCHSAHKGNQRAMLAGSFVLFLFLYGILGIPRPDMSGIFESIDGVTAGIGMGAETIVEIFGGR